MHLTLAIVFLQLFDGMADEDTNAAVEITAVANVIGEIERCVREQDIEADGGAHQFKV